MKKFMRIAFFALIIVMGAMFQVQAGQKEIHDDVIYVTNSDVSNHNNNDLILEELWSIGGENEDDVIFKYVSSVIRDRDQIYILDTSLSEVHQYTIDGALVKVHDISGEAAGSCNHPNNILLLEPGLFGLVKGRPARIIVTDLADNARSSIYFVNQDVNNQTSFMVMAIEYSYKQLIVFNEAMHESWGDRALSIFKLQEGNYGVEAVEHLRLFSQKTDFSSEIPNEEDQEYYYSKFLSDLSSDGLLYVVPNRDQYRIEVYDQDGHLKRVVTKEFKSYLRSWDEELYDTYLLSGRYMYPAPYAAIISGLRIDDQGHLWIRHSYSDRGDAYRTYDVFTSDGHYIRTTSLIYPGNGLRDDVYFLGDGLVAIVKGRMDAERRGFFSENPDSWIEEDLGQVILCRIVSTQ